MPIDSETVFVLHLERVRPAAQVKAVEQAMLDSEENVCLARVYAC